MYLPDAAATKLRVNDGVTVLEGRGCAATDRGVRRGRDARQALLQRAAADVKHFKISIWYMHLRYKD